MNNRLYSVLIFICNEAEINIGMYVSVKQILRCYFIVSNYVLMFSLLFLVDDGYYWNNISSHATKFFEFWETKIIDMY